MAACGESYWGLIKTGLGTTPESPFWALGAMLGVASPEDWNAWHGLAERLYAQANEAYKRLGAVEEAKGEGFPKWNAILPQQHATWSALKAMGSFWEHSPSEGVPLAIDVCKQAVCLLEMSDEALASYGKKPSPAGVKPKEPKGWFSSAVDAVVPYALIAGVGFLAYRSFKE